MLSDCTKCFHLIKRFLRDSRSTKSFSPPHPKPFHSTRKTNLIIYSFRKSFLLRSIETKQQRNRNKPESDQQIVVAVLHKFVVLLPRFCFYLVSVFVVFFFSFKSGKDKRQRQTAKLVHRMTQPCRSFPSAPRRNHLARYLGDTALRLFS